MGSIKKRIWDIIPVRNKEFYFEKDVMREQLINQNNYIKCLIDEVVKVKEEQTIITERQTSLSKEIVDYSETILELVQVVKDETLNRIDDKMVEFNLNNTRMIEESTTLLREKDRKSVV